MSRDELLEQYNRKLTIEEAPDPDRPRREIVWPGQRGFRLTQAEIDQHPADFNRRKRPRFTRRFYNCALTSFAWHRGERETEGGR